MMARMMGLITSHTQEGVGSWGYMSLSGHPVVIAAPVTVKASLYRHGL